MDHIVVRLKVPHAALRRERTAKDVHTVQHVVAEDAAIRSHRFEGLMDLTVFYQRVVLVRFNPERQPCQRTRIDQDAPRDEALIPCGGGAIDRGRGLVPRTNGGGNVGGHRRTGAVVGRDRDLDILDHDVTRIDTDRRAAPRRGA